jgi:hypothetical protein
MHITETPVASDVRHFQTRSPTKRNHGQHSTMLRLCVLAFVRGRQCTMCWTQARCPSAAHAGPTMHSLQRPKDKAHAAICHARPDTRHSGRNLRSWQRRTVSNLLVMGGQIPKVHAWQPALK